MTRRWPLLACLALIACDDGGDATPDPTADRGAAIDMAAIDAGPTPDAALDADVVADMAPDPDMAGPTCPPLDIAGPPGHVNTTEGFVQGHEADGVWAWKGVPFAAPPVGELRFMPPAAPACRAEGTLDAAAFGAKCAQIDPANGGTVGAEDCLTLNIWSPAFTDDGAARPVLVFIHGGGNIVGSASETLGRDDRFTYSGHHLAARGDVVVITLQYRLGMLGNASLPGMDTNLGLRDQIAALEWVQANVARFGGDPGRVMIFGESAGAVNTCSLMTSPLSAGLFHRALMQSGGCGAATAAQAEMRTAAAAETLGCAIDDLACLQALDAATIMAETSGSVGIGGGGGGFGQGWGPSIDGAVLPGDPYAAFTTGGAHAVPFVVGSNADEMASQAINRVRIATAAQYERTLEAAFGAAAAERILAAYPVDAYDTPNDAFIQVATDAYFTCPARIIARLGTARDAPTWRYFFQRRAETARGSNPAAHGIELVYVFGTYVDIPLYRPADGEHAVAGRMMDAWIRFARDGDPAGEGVEAWPAYALEDEVSRVFDDPPVGPTAGVRGEKCDVWEALLNGE